MKNVLRFITLFVILFIIYLPLVAQTFDNPCGIVYWPEKQGYIVTEQGKYDNQQSTVYMGPLMSLWQPGQFPVHYDYETFTPKGLFLSGDTLFFNDGGNVYVHYFSNETGGLLLNNHDGRTIFRGLCYDGYDNVFVSDTAKDDIYQITLSTGKSKRFAFESILDNPIGLIWDAATQKVIIVSAVPNAPIQALNPADSTIQTLMQTNISNMYGITKDNEGDYYVSSWGNKTVGDGKIYKINGDFSGQPVIFADSLSGPALLYYNTYNDTLAVPEMLGGKITLFTMGLPVPILINVGGDKLPISTTPTFNWLNSKVDSYQLQVATSTSITSKKEESPQADDFSTPVIDKSGITDTFYIAETPLVNNQKYIWRVRSVKGTKTSPWSNVLNFTVGKVTDVPEINPEEIIKIYPNPVINSANIHVSPMNNLSGTIEITDIFGRNINTFNLSANSDDINWSTSNLSAGIYFVTLKSGDKVYTRQVTVLK